MPDNKEIFLQLEKPSKPFGDVDYLIYMDDILHTHKWLECVICGELKVIKKGYSFVRFMKKLGWIYKPAPEKSRKKWQRKIWQCPDCQKKIDIDEYLSKKERLSDIARIEQIRPLTDNEKCEEEILFDYLSKYDPFLNELSKITKRFKGEK